MDATSGRFLTLEGMEGAGKSTNLAFICDYLDAAGIDFLVTREPGGTPRAEVIREALLSVQDEPLNACAELLLIFAARAQHIAEVIEPALSAGRWVVCDRFTDATYAYQGGARGLGFEVVEQLETLVQDKLRPDVTIFLDVPVEVSVERTRSRGALDRFEREPAEFFQRVRDAYLMRVAGAPHRYRVVDANQPLRAVQNDLKVLLDLLLSGTGKNDCSRS